MKYVDAVIIGAGTSGIAALATMVSGSIDAVCLEQKSDLRGLDLEFLGSRLPTLHRWEDKSARKPAVANLLKLSRSSAQSTIAALQERIKLETRAWAVRKTEDDHFEVGIVSAGVSSWLQCRFLTIAVGGHEVPSQVEGWRASVVHQFGSVPLNGNKGTRLARHHRIAVAGGGFALGRAVHKLRRSGYKIATVIDGCTAASYLAAAPSLYPQPARLLADCLNQIRLALSRTTKLYRGYQVKSVSGEAVVTILTLQKNERAQSPAAKSRRAKKKGSRPLRKSILEVAADALVCVGCIAPDIRITASLGAEIVVDKITNTAQVAVDPDFRTSVVGLFCIGNSAYEMTPESSFDSGTIAGNAVLVDSDRYPKAATRERLAKLKLLIELRQRYQNAERGMSVIGTASEPAPENKTPAGAKLKRDGLKRDGTLPSLFEIDYATSSERAAKKDAEARIDPFVGGGGTGNGGSLAYLSQFSPSDNGTDERSDPLISRRRYYDFRPLAPVTLGQIVGANQYSPLWHPALDTVVFAPRDEAMNNHE